MVAPVAFGVLLWVCYTIFTHSIFYNTRSAPLLPLVTAAGAIANIAGNLLLIPYIGIMGAAWATCLSYGVFALVAWRVGMHFAPVPYAFRKWAAVLGWTALSMTAYHVIDASQLTLLVRVGLKAMWLAGSLLVTAGVAGVTPTTLRELRTRFAKR